MGYREPDAEEMLRVVRADNEHLRQKLALYENGEARVARRRLRAVLTSLALLVGLVSMCPITLWLYGLMGKVLVYFNITDNVAQPFATGGVIIAVVVAVAFGIERWNKPA